MLPGEAALAARESLQPSASESAHETVRSRMRECLDRRERARCALTLLLQSTTFVSGHLYATASLGALELLSSLSEGETEPGMQDWAERYARDAFDQEQLDGSATTGEEAAPGADNDAGSGAQVRSRYRDRDGRLWQARPLFDGPSFAGLLVLPVEGAQSVLARELCTTIAHELLEHGDATGWRAF